jgi:hypothetical protein
MIEAITATCRQKLSQGRLERFGMVEDVGVDLRQDVSTSYRRISSAMKPFIVSPVGNNN